MNGNGCAEVEVRGIIRKSVVRNGRFNPVPLDFSAEGSAAVNHATPFPDTS
ncbi:MAG: hypothetical protein JST22_18195 [Bacteroidetes bacterium]|nr:hypothetical protein [Bacteroidota bacterium]